jgi:hypothetical protein
MQKKYGFVYIWYDRKHKRYYIGCHWGTIDDGYICSSSWMKRSYKRRPQDFKRKILVTNIHCRKQMLTEEYRYLSMIKKEELRKKYYNLHNHHFNHWASDINSLLTVGEKIKISHSRPELKQKFRESKLGDKNPMKRPEVAERAGKSKKGMKTWNKGLTKETSSVIAEQGKKHSLKMKGKSPWNKDKKMTEEYKLKVSKSTKNKKWCYNPITNEEKTIISEEYLPKGYIFGRPKGLPRKRNLI